MSDTYMKSFNREVVTVWLNGCDIAYFSEEGNQDANDARADMLIRAMKAKVADNSEKAVVEATKRVRHFESTDAQYGLLDSTEWSAFEDAVDALNAAEETITS